jgi:hypothetical protein
MFATIIIENWLGQFDVAGIPFTTNTVEKAAWKTVVHESCR